MTDQQPVLSTKAQPSEKGGARPGAGRKPLPGKFVTSVVISDSLKDEFKRLGGSKWVRAQIERAIFERSSLPPEAMLPQLSSKACRLPLADSRVRTRFPFFAETHVGDRVDLNELIIDVPAATFYIRVKGDSMNLAGIDEGDLLVVDHSKEAQSGDIVITDVNEEFTVNRLIKKDAAWILHPESSNPAYSDIIPKERDVWNIVGVVTYIIKKAHALEELP